MAQTDWFPGFPDQARLWVFGFSHRLSEEHFRLLKSRMEEFLSRWASHEQRVRGAWALLHDQFALLTGEVIGGPTGCSIDSSFEVFKTLKAEAGLDALDRSIIFYQKDGAIHTADRAVFGTMVSSREILGDTLVYDLTLQTVGELRSRGFSVPFENCWHSKAFPVPA